MPNREYDFCSSYVGEFLTIVNYPDNAIDLTIYEQYREYALIDLKKEFGDSPFYAKFEQEINDDYDKKIFDFIKNNVALVSPDFFNLKIKILNQLLNDYSDIAVKLGMVVPAIKIADFYGNYLIALGVLARIDLKNTLTQGGINGE